MKRIMVAVDGSVIADRVLETACELARDFAAELVLVNVEQGFFHQDTGGSEASPGATMDEVLYAASGRVLDHAAEKARALGVTKIRTQSGLGDPAGAILEFVKQEMPDLIVVGRRGRGQLASLLLGSVSHKLVSLAPCKVLVVP